MLICKCYNAYLMFEQRSNRQLIIIYAFIALVIAFFLAILHMYQGFNPYYIIIAANIEFFCIFYLLYLPIKVKNKQH